MSGISLVYVKDAMIHLIVNRWFVQVYIYVYMYVYIVVHMYTYTCTYLHVYVCTDIFIHVQCACIQLWNTFIGVLSSINWYADASNVIFHIIVLPL